MMSYYLGNDEHWKYGFKSTKVFFVRANMSSAGDDIVELRFAGYFFIVFVFAVFFDVIIDSFLSVEIFA